MAAIPETKEQLMYFINLCEKALLYDEMVEAMKKLLKISPDLNTAERTLFAIAFKGAMSIRRTSWRALCSIEDRTYENSTDAQRQVLESYREELEHELIAICQDALACINETLFPKAADAESKVYYLKMKGDYYRYMAEVATDEDRSGVVELTKQAYQEAFDIATAQLKPTSGTRLGLALNFAVFHSEILKSVDDARQMAQKAIDDAKAESSKDEMPIPEEAAVNISLLQENLDFWMAGNNNNG